MDEEIIQVPKDRPLVELGLWMAIREIETVGPQELDVGEFGDRLV